MLEGVEVMEDLKMLEEDAPILDEQNRPQIMMLSLRNKNKSKTFRKSMHAPIPARIIFDEPASLPVAAKSLPSARKTLPAALSEAVETPETSQAPPPSHPYTHIVPPSERASLPSNIFVTSIDVEEGLWSKKGGKSKSKKNKKKQTGTREWKEELLEQSLHDESEVVVDELFYGVPETDSDPKTPAQFDYPTAELAWDTYTPVSALNQVTTGKLVGWKVSQHFSPPPPSHCSKSHWTTDTGAINKPTNIHPRKHAHRRADILCYI